MGDRAWDKTVLAGISLVWGLVASLAAARAAPRARRKKVRRACSKPAVVTRWAAGLCLTAIFLPTAVRAQGHVGPEMQANSYTPNNQRNPSIAFTGTDFIVVWEGSSPDDTDGGIFARRFEGGAQQGAEFLINSGQQHRQGNPSISENGFGRFVVVWDTQSSTRARAPDTPTPTPFPIKGRIFESNGVPESADFVVTGSNGDGFSQFRPSVAHYPLDTTFIVVWNGRGGTISILESVLARRFDSNSTALDDDFFPSDLVDSNIFPQTPSVVARQDGSFIIVWEEYPSDIFMQRYNSDGSALGTKSRVNEYTTSNQSNPAIGADDSGSFVMVWQSNANDGTYQATLQVGPPSAVLDGRLSRDLAPIGGRKCCKPKTN